MRRRWAALVVSILAVGCGGDSGSPTAPPTPPPAPTVASFTVTASPSPIIADIGSQVGCDSRYQYSTSTNLTITETAGLGGNVNYVNLTMRNSTTGVELNTLNYDANWIIGRAGSNHVNGRGSLTIRNVRNCYTLAGSGRQASNTYTVSITDDRGNQHNKVITVPVV